MTLTAHLKPHREKPLIHGHPWVFSGAISRWAGERKAGAPVDVVSSEGQWVGRGLAQPEADLAIRIYTRQETESIDAALFERRIDGAVALRERLPTASAKSDSHRIIFSESDGISGLIVDRYADVLSISVSTASLMPHLPTLIAALRKRTGLHKCVVVADRDAVTREKLDANAVAAFSTAPEGLVRICESGFAYDVDIAGGQKTGFYLDQRENRLRVARYAAGRSVLSGYCYTGAFELHAAREGAKEIIALDSSGPALERARHHATLNALPIPIDYREADVPLALRKFRDENRKFDLIILDPPRFITSAAQKEKGFRAYKDINLLALKLLNPGGILATFSCSGLVSSDDLQRVLQWSAEDSRRNVRILEKLGQPADHPVAIGFSEAEYLCGFILHAD